MQRNMHGQGLESGSVIIGILQLSRHYLFVVIIQVLQTNIQSGSDMQNFASFVSHSIGNHGSFFLPFPFNIHCPFVPQSPLVHILTLLPHLSNFIHIRLLFIQLILTSKMRQSPLFLWQLLLQIVKFGNFSCLFFSSYLWSGIVFPLSNVTAA